MQVGVQSPKLRTYSKYLGAPSSDVNGLAWYGRGFARCVSPRLEKRIGDRPTTSSIGRDLGSPNMMCITS